MKAHGVVVHLLRLVGVQIWSKRRYSIQRCHHAQPRRYRSLQFWWCWNVTSFEPRSKSGEIRRCIGRRCLEIRRLNPAKLLHIDDEVGSVKVGKSADLVLWSDHPMSIYAVAENLIEGVFTMNWPCNRTGWRYKRNATNSFSKCFRLKMGVHQPKRHPKDAREFHCETLD